MSASSSSSIVSLSSLPLLKIDSTFSTNPFLVFASPFSIGQKGPSNLLIKNLIFYAALALLTLDTPLPSSPQRGGRVKLRVLLKTFLYTDQGSCSPLGCSKSYNHTSFFSAFRLRSIMWSAYFTTSELCSMTTTEFPRSISVYYLKLFVYQQNEACCRFVEKIQCVAC